MESFSYVIAPDASLPLKYRWETEWRGVRSFQELSPPDSGVGPSQAPPESISEVAGMTMALPSCSNILQGTIGQFLLLISLGA